LRRIAAEWLAACVDEDVDAMVGEQAKESFDIDVAVADAVKGHK